MRGFSRTPVPSLVDAHVHLFDPEQRRYPWLTDVPTINRPHLLQDYQAALNDITVESFVFVEVAAHDEDGMDEARWVADRSWPDVVPREDSPIHSGSGRCVRL